MASGDGILAIGQLLLIFLASGAGTNLKVWGGTNPERKWGHRSGVKRRKKYIWSCPLIFGSKSTVGRFGERFRDGQYSLVSFLFAVLLLTVPPCPAICKSGGGARPRASWSRSSPLLPAQTYGWCGSVGLLPSTHSISAHDHFMEFRVRIYFADSLSHL